MCFTIEPGFYVQPGDREAPAEFQNIGIRIEDDILVTSGGCENLTIGAPKERGEIEAAVAQGFSELQIFRFIVLPQALRVCVPSLANQVIRNVKDTSLASLVQYTEFFARIQEVASGDFQFFAAYLFAGSIYLMFVSAIVIAARQVERRYPAPGWQP